MNTLKQQLVMALNIDDEASLEAVQGIIDDVKPHLSKSDVKIMNEAYQYQKDNPLTEVVWRKLSSEFTSEQIQLFIDINSACMDAMDESSSKIGEILSKVKMDSPLAMEYQDFLDAEFPQNKQLH
jgi:hypothetical protein